MLTSLLVDLEKNPAHRWRFFFKSAGQGLRQSPSSCIVYGVVRKLPLQTILVKQ